MPPTVKSTCAGLCVARLQAPCLDAFRPGQWTTYCHSKDYAIVTWKLTGPDNLKATVHGVLTATAMEDDRNFVLQSSSAVTADRQRFRYYFFTPVNQWVDLVTGTVAYSGNTAEARFFSGSTGVCPASCPGALLGSLLCACVPIDDMGKNLLHLQDLKDLLQAAGVTVSNEAVLAAGCADVPNSQNMSR